MAGGVAGLALADSESDVLSAEVPFVDGSGLAFKDEVVGTPVLEGCGVIGLACVTGGAGDAVVGGVPVFGA